MSTPASSLIGKVWNYAHVLRDAGVGYGDYVEQITYLLFLKLDYETASVGRPSLIPPEYNWASLVRLDGDALQVHYQHILAELGRLKEAQQATILQTIFNKAQNKITQPALLRRLVGLIDSEDWSGLDIDIKGEIYEGLLQKNAEDVKGGAGQYFTPRPLIRAMVQALRLEPGQTVFDPACGTGGFLLAAYEYLSGLPLDRDQKIFLREHTLFGVDIVDSVVRLAAMNMYLHGIGGLHSPIRAADSLAADPGTRYDVVLANPPFGKKSAIEASTSTENGKASREKVVYERDDFIATTSNKQLNFLQHIKTVLKIGGKAAVVLPDNVLFEGGAGETIRRRLLHDCEVHTLLRLPTGIFYAQGVKANVLFFEKRPASETPWTRELWVYDLRTNLNFTLKTNPLTDKDLSDFLACYNPEARHQRQETERFRRFSYDELVARDKANLDIFWLKDKGLEDSLNLPPPEVLAREIIADLEAALEGFRTVEEELGEARG
ncbi:MAG: type I restriction-modification system subunit M [Thermaceae bacterium]|nr:type I restriction-modification system subunit M [Thermaceae bacterium]